MPYNLGAKSQTFATLAVTAAKASSMTFPTTLPVLGAKKPMRLATVLGLSLFMAGCGDSASNEDANQPSPTHATSGESKPAATPSNVTMVDPAPPAFATCRSCHSTQAGQHGIGPSLFGIIGAKAGTMAGYSFSPALKSSEITWDRASLDQWLRGPMKMVPGTKMVLPVSDPAKRAAIIAYLETLK